MLIQCIFANDDQILGPIVQNIIEAVKAIQSYKVCLVRLFLSCLSITQASLCLFISFVFLSFVRLFSFVSLQLLLTAVNQ